MRLWNKHLFPARSSIRSKDLGQGLMRLTSGGVIGQMTECLGLDCLKQVNVKDIFCKRRVSLATLRSLRLPEVVNAVLVKADWIPLP